MAQIAEVIFKIDAKASGLSGEMAKTTKEAGRFQGGMQKAADAAKPLFVASTAVVGSMVGMAAKAGATADDLNTLSAITGMSTEELQKFKYASDLVDVSQETMTSSLKKLTMSIGNAEKGTGKAKGAFDQLGVSIKGPDGQLRSTTEIFDDTIKKLSGVKNETERNALAMDIFGRSAMDLNPIINDGGAGLEHYSKRMEELGLVTSQESLDGANAFNDVIDETKSIVEAAGLKIGSKLAPSFQKLGETVQQVITDVVQFIDTFSEEQIDLFIKVAGAIAAISGAIILINTAVKIASATQAAFNAVMLANPMVFVIGAIIAIIILLIMNWDKVKAAFSAGINSIVGWFGGLGNSIKGAFNGAINWVKTKFDWLKAMINLFIGVAKMQFAKVKNIIMTPFRVGIDWVKNKFDWLKKSIGNVIGGIGGFISNMFTGAINNIKKMINSFMISPLNGAVGIINKIPGVNIPKIPMLAKGGIVDQATLAIIGEAGSEAVVPMENDRVMSTLANKILSKGANVTTPNNSNSVANSTSMIIDKLFIQARDYEDVEKGLLKLAKGSGF